MTFLKIFDVVPGWLYALALAIVLTGIGVQTMRLHGAQVTVAERDTTIARRDATIARRDAAISKGKADAATKLAKP